MIGSTLINWLIAALTVAAVRVYTAQSPARVALRYFTTLSNLLCALSALIVALYRFGDGVPQWALMLKFVGTAAVTVTLLTVLLFLAPALGSLKQLISGPDLYMHLVCPVLAIVSLILWDHPQGPLPMFLLGAVPVVLYGPLYLYKVIYAPPEKRWEDFYGFNRGGKWPVSFAAMMIAAVLISLVLWVI